MHAPAPERLIKGGLLTEAMVAYVLVAKYAWHRRSTSKPRCWLPKVSTSNLRSWRYGSVMRPPNSNRYLRLRELILTSGKIVMDETVAPVLDPGRGRTKQGYFWAIARNDRPWGGTDPPAVAYSYAPGRGSVHASSCSTIIAASCNATAMTPTRALPARLQMSSSSSRTCSGVSRTFPNRNPADTRAAARCRGPGADDALSESPLSLDPLYRIQRRRAVQIARHSQRGRNGTTSACGGLSISSTSLSSLTKPLCFSSRKSCRS
jgi:Transposase IS66 family